MLKKMSLPVKIGGGFGVVITLLVIISFVSLDGLKSVTSGFTSYRELARQTNLVNLLQANMLMIRMNVKGFLINQNDSSYQEYNRYYTGMESSLEDAKKQIENPEKAGLITDYSKDVFEYNSIFHEVTSLYHDRSKIVEEVLLSVGPEMERKLTAIMIAARENNEAETTYLSGVAMRHLLLGRLYVQKSLDTNSTAYREKVENEFSSLLEQLEKLQRLLKDRALIIESTALTSMSNDYLAAFIKLQGIMKTVNVLVTEKLEVMGPKMADDLAEVTHLVQKDQDTLGPLVQKKSDIAVKVVFTISLTAIVLALIAAYFITKIITTPVQSVVRFIETLAEGDFTSKLEVNQKDEIGRMSTALGNTVEKLGSMIRDITVGVNTLSSSSGSLSAVASQLSSVSEEATSRVGGVASASEELSANMNSVSAAMEQSSSNVNVVATAAEEMSATVAEIAENTARARVISDEAVNQSEMTSNKINELGNAADRIGKVTEAITEISEQTNLLALNATIEAARAGEAGKGFAVVANEIKELAKQTAGATVDIKNQIEGMQLTTGTTIKDIESIANIINEINDVITTIATAVEQQSAVTSEIAENVSQASLGISEVNENVAQSSVAVSDISVDISEISNGADEISQSSNNVKESSKELADLAEHLNTLVMGFKVQ